MDTFIIFIFAIFFISLFPWCIYSEYRKMKKTKEFSRGTITGVFFLVLGAILLILSLIIYNHSVTDVYGLYTYKDEKGMALFYIALIMGIIPSLTGGILLFLKYKVKKEFTNEMEELLNTKMCTTCGKVVRNTERFCPKCGKELTSQQKTNS